MSQSQEPWLGWAAALIPMALLAVWSFVKRFLSFVTRAEFMKMLKTHEEKREEQRMELHRENIANFRTLFDRLGKVEQSQARTEGMLSGRYPRIDR